jgi:hypothetical protein
MTVTLTTTAGTLAFGSVAGLSAVTNNAATITGTGTQTNINNALQGLVFTPTVNINGAQTISLTTSDLGNSGSGGTMTDIDTINLSITAINDAPVLTTPASANATEDVQTGNIAISVTDVDSGAGTNFQATLSVTNGTINVTPSGATVGGNNSGSVTITGTVAQVNAAFGTTKYTGNSNFNGTDTMVVNVTDNGQTGSGGALTDGPDSITINVAAVNDPPVAQDKIFTAQAHMRINGLTGLLTGATDPDNGTGPGPCSSTTFTIGTVTPVSGGAIANLNTSTGTFDFLPTAGFTGAATLNYTIVDTGCPGPAATSAAATITINVAGPPIYFVKSAPVGAGDCTLGNECTLSTAVTNIGASVGRHIFISDANTHAAAVPLNSGGDLVGQGAVAASFDALFGITPPSGTVARPAIGLARPTVGGTVTMNTNSDVNGINIAVSGNVSGLVATGRTGLFVNVGTVTTSNNSANATYAVNLGTSSGSGFTFGNITGGGTGALSHGVLFASTTSPATVSFANINSTLGNAFDVSNSGTTNFSFGNISSTSGTAFNATSSGAGDFSAGTITSTTGTAVRVATASGDFTFVAVNANGATNGIDVSALAAPGTFTVNGVGTSPGTGGTLQNCSANGAKFVNASGVTLKNMNLTANGTAQTVAGAATTCGGDLVAGNNLQCVANLYIQNGTGIVLDRLSVTNSRQMGINGNGVNTLSLTNSTITGNGNESSENGVTLQNTAGSLTVTSNTLVDNAARQMYVAQNGAQTLTFNTTSTSFSRTVDGTASAGQGLLIDLYGSSNTTFTGTGLTFSRAQGLTQQNAFALNVNGTASMPASSISNSTFDIQAAGVIVTSGSSGNVTFNTINNVINHNAIQGILYGFLGAAGTGSLTGTIQSNQIGNTAIGCITAGASCAGISINSGNDWHGQFHLKVDQNTIRQVTGGILLTIDGAAGGTTPQAHVKITSNTINTPSGNADDAIRISQATLSANPNINGCYDVGGASLQNVISGDWAGASAAASIYFRQRFSGSGSWLMPGYGGAGNGDAAVQTYLEARNTIALPSGGFVRTLVTHSPAAGTPFGAAASCNTP